jgi:hypothetical protein
MAITEVSAAVRIRVSDKAHAASLRAFLEAAECAVRSEDATTLDVSMPRAPSDAQALREICIYLKTWRAMNPDSHAQLLGERRSDPD